ncbi:hypothetical protein NEOKW01_0254 [Nematocida sp. AWRm80]|nr:hypothetical protein NEOKW01_0254 [Nematocida sp. AWRm80]
MQVIGDICRVKAFTLEELEQKARIEEILATECDLSALLGIDPKNTEIEKTAIKSVIKQHIKVCTHTCTCEITHLKGKKYISLANLIHFRKGKSILSEVQKSYMIPKNNTLRKEYQGILTLIRQIVFTQKYTIPAPVELFLIWMLVNILIMLFIHVDKLWRNTNIIYSLLIATRLMDQ